VIEEKKSIEDYTMCEKEKNAHLMDMMGHGIHIFHTSFNFIS
jgi:hypothetical protein